MNVEKMIEAIKRDAQGRGNVARQALGYLALLDATPAKKPVAKKKTTRRKKTVAKKGDDE